MRLLQKLKWHFIIVLLLFSFYQAVAQPINESEKQFLFFKTWNFLKYYHPTFASGQKNADSVFLDKQVLLEKINSKREFTDFLITVINGLNEGVSELRISNADNQALKSSPTHRWFLENKAVSKELRTTLLHIYQNRDTVGMHYVPRLNYITEIPNEDRYEYPDSVNLPRDIRMLALAKLQGVIDYLYPHKALMSESWDQTIKENILPFKNCGSRMEYEKLLLKIVAKLNDSHAYNRFYHSLTYKKEIFKNSFYPPFAYKIFEKKILITGIIIPELCIEAGVKVGDEITAINGQSIGNRIEKLSRLLSASNRHTLIYKLNDYVTNFIWSGLSSHFSLEVSSSEGKKKTLVQFVSSERTAEREKINGYLQRSSEREAAAEPFQVMHTNIAYFNINKIHELLKGVEEEDVDEKMDSLLNMAAKQNGMIFDMRGYPRWGGFIYHYIYKKFAHQNHLFAQYVQADTRNLGDFTPIPETSTYYPSGVKAETLAYKGKVCIIVNAQTQSLSEWNTMSLQHIFPDAITIGEQTAGADGDEKFIHLPGGYRVYFTGNAINYPNGVSAQGVGVKIDKIVKPKMTDILSGRDTQLDFAIKLVIANRSSID